MTKMRVHELARELGMDNKELVDILQKKNVEIKNHMSTIEDNIAEEIRSEVSSKGEKKTSGEEEKAAGKAAEQAESVDFRHCGGGGAPDYYGIFPFLFPAGGAFPGTDAEGGGREF